MHAIVDHHDGVREKEDFAVEIDRYMYIPLSRECYSRE